MSIKPIKKLYYSIGDVSQITGLKQYVLRYWETEFSILKPTKNSAGNRTYKDNDIKIIKHIQNLLYTKKFTIKGAKQYLKDYYSANVNDTKIVNISNQSINNELLEIKSKLERIISIIDNSK